MTFSLKLVWRRSVLLPLISSALLAAMCFEVGETTHAEQSATAVLSVRVDDLKNSQDDIKASLATLATSLQEQRDKQNQLQGMLIGFGGFAALLQVLNLVLQFRGDKAAKG